MSEYLISVSIDFVDGKKKFIYNVKFVSFHNSDLGGIKKVLLTRLLYSRFRDRSSYLITSKTRVVNNSCFETRLVNWKDV